MKILSCKRAKRMMPLYVGGDLYLNEERAIAGHLAVCETCHQLAAEFHQSQNFLSEESATPSFDREFYEEIKHAVLAEVAQRQSNTKSFFGARWIYAMTIAILLVGFAFLLGRWREPAPAPALTNAAANSEPDNVRNRESLVVPGALPEKLPHPRGTKESIRRARLAAASPKQLQVPGKTESPETVSLVSNASSRGELSRIEIQTGNPNIKIIWLVQDAGQSDTRDKDEHRNRE